MSLSPFLRNKTWICFGLVVIGVIADTNLLFYERSPSKYLLLRILIDLVSIASIFCAGIWLSLSRGIISKLFLILLVTLTVLDCAYAHILGKITSTSLLLVSAVLQPAGGMRNGYQNYIAIMAILIAIFGFLLRGKSPSSVLIKQYFGWSALALFAVQLFVVFPNARHPAAHLTIKYRGLANLPSVGYQSSDRDWGLKPGVTMDYLLPQLRSLPGIVGDILSVVALQIDPGTLPMPRAEKKLPYFLKSSSIKQPLANTIILVIGESSAAQHWGLLGANNKTTPELDKLYAGHRVDFISKSHSPADMTRIAVLPQISMWSPNNLKGDREYENIIELAKDRGYKTFYFSGSWDLGQWSGDIGQIAETADVVRMNGPLSHGKNSLIEDPRPEHFWISDQDAFALSEKVLGDNAEKKLIIIHQMGSHWPYTSDDIDKTAMPEATLYDLTIHKTDRLLAHLINRLNEANSESSSLLIYASDHGEVPNGKYSAHYGMDYKGNDYIVPVVIAGTAQDIICKLAEDLRSSDGWYSTNMNKYLVISALGYNFSKSSIGVDAQTDNIIAEDEGLYDWLRYYQPDAATEN